MKNFRLGAQKDVAAIEKSFKSIGFRVEVNNDLKADAVRKALPTGELRYTIIICNQCRFNPQCTIPK